MLVLYHLGVLEVHKPNISTFGIIQNVFRFYITVADPKSMEVLDSLKDSVDDLGGLVFSGEALFVEEDAKIFVLAKFSY